MVNKDQAQETGLEVTHKAMMENELNYIHVSEQNFFSTHPHLADEMSVMVIMHNLVGTLTKFTGSGSFAPNLAKSWVVREEGRRWDFKLHSGLKSQNGETITADRFVRSFRRSLKMHQSEGVTPVFDQLEGWQTFLDGEDHALSVRALGELTVSFKFKKRINNLLELLAFPYYGYFVDEDFDSHGKWKSETSITSTGPYILESVDDNLVTIRRRKDWSLEDGKMPEVIRFMTIASVEQAVEKYESRTIIDLSFRQDKYPEYKGYRYMTSLPQGLYYWAFNVEDPPFNDPNARKAVYDKLKQKMKQNPFDVSSTSLATSFYPNFLGQIPPENKKSSETFKKEGIEITVPQLSQSRFSKYFRSIRQEVFEELGFKVKVIKADKHDIKTQTEVKKNRATSIRSGVVDIGGKPDNDINKLMFCMTVGVSFPDPSGRLCKLINDYEEQNATMNYEFYWKEFETIIAEDRAVIPILHMGNSWFISNDLDVSEISPTMSYMPVNQVRLK